MTKQQLHDLLITTYRAGFKDGVAWLEINKNTENIEPWMINHDADIRANHYANHNPVKQ
ncbi:hypothetical protein [Rheinheimera sp. MMS21-TC3]|uniref:hypothetical protein n=1 Tax=Rheinheimera sp. MMS21-TC3 TaxID=3072790 RepID=UPI0028C41CD0|nr:hypothetical protein [Rheinheimera sp. MMS21-TC3]WNO60404.1 hypothetical protein RDV63_05405 [Rheinheimera sp. MMS21-TC3]